MKIVAKLFDYVRYAFIDTADKTFDTISDVRSTRDFFQRILCILLIFCTISVALPPEARSADTPPDIADSSETISGGKYATPPECGISLTDIALIVATLYVMYNTIKMGIQLLIQAAKDVNPITKAQAIIMGSAAVASGTAAAITFAATSVIAACLYSFVRDPVYRQQDNLNSMRKKGGGNTSNYWEAQPAPYSDYLQVCQRLMVPFTALVPDASCNKVGGITMYSSSADYYDGRDSMLCPEEWRNGGYKRDTNDSGEIMGPNAVANLGSSNYNDKLIAMKKTSGPVSCHIGKLGDQFNLNGYVYTIRKMGGKLCGVIKGPSIAGSVAPFSTPRIVGCHYGTPEPPQPMCDSSIPIRTDSTKNANGTVQPGTGSGKITAYDDSSCFECYLAYWCHAHSLRVSQAIISVIAPLLHCVQESMNLVLNGCGNTGGGQPGLVDTIQNRLARVVQIAAALAIAFFAMNAVMGLGDVSKSDIMVLTLKIAFVMFATKAGTTTQKGGMQQLTSMTFAISNGLSKIVMGGGLSSGLCNYNTNDYILRSNVGGAQAGTDYSYIMVLDMLDCMLFYVLGGTILTSAEIDDGKMVNAIMRMWLLPLALVFSFFDILGAILVIAFNILVVVLIIWVVLFLILAIFGMALTTLFSPIFIPMLLLPYCNSWFQGWLKEWIAYHLIPVFLFGFLGFVFSMYYVMFYDPARFVSRMVKIGNRQVKYFAIDQNYCFDVVSDEDKDNSSSERQCGCPKNKAGCKLAELSFFTDHLIFGIKATKVSSRVSAADLCLCVITTFILVRFLVLLPSIVAELSGGARSFNVVSGAVSSPNKIAQKLASGIKKIASSGSKKGEGNDKKGGGGDNKQGGGESSSSGGSSDKTSSGGGGKSDSVSRGGPT